MASIISAGTTSGTALNMAGDTSGVLQLATNGSTTAVTIDTSQNTTFVGKVTSAGALTLASNGSTTALTIDTSQNVGIGTTATINSERLGVWTVSGSGIKQATVINNAHSYGVGVGVAASALTFTRSRNTSEFYPMSQIVSGNESETTSASGYMAFYTTSTTQQERMRIDSSGNVLIGATSLPPGASATRFYVVQPAADYSAFFASSSATAANNYGPFIKYTAASPNNGTNEFLACVDSSVTRMTVRSNGGIANYSGNNVNLSDQREKTNIEVAGSYLDKICSIPVKTFNYIDQNMEEDDGLTLGVIAQDVQAVAPELVMESNWASKDEPEKLRLSIYQTDLQYALMKCIQEQQTIINDLKARITALEGAA